MITSFRQFLESTKKTLVVTFGRFNPPTIGHEKLLDAVARVAKSNDYAIYASQSNDPQKNPLTYEDKIKFMRKMFPKYARNIHLDKSIKTIFNVADKAHSNGYTNLILVVGEDRVAEFTKLLNKYNGETRRDGYYKFDDGISVISAGERDPDADDVTGMSASKMRIAAANNELELFRSGLPREFGEFIELFNDVRKGMGLKESHNFQKHVSLPKVSDIRELYASGKVFRVGDKGLYEGKEVCIIARKPNFVVCRDAQNKEHKCWLDKVTPLAT